MQVFTQNESEFVTYFTVFSSLNATKIVSFHSYWHIFCLIFLAKDKN